MTIRQILTEPDPKLRIKSKSVTKVDKEINLIVSDPLMSKALSKDDLFYFYNNKIYNINFKIYIIIFNIIMTLLVAEIGWNFLGNIKLAKKMILSAKKAGADAVKFQIWDPKYLKNGTWDNDGRKEIYQKAFINKSRYKILKNFSA